MSVVDIIADEHSDQPKVSYSKQLSPMSAMPEPQMHPYRLIKKYGNISKCHGCEANFDKRKTTMILFRIGMDWWPKLDKVKSTSQWKTCTKTFYYYVSLSCMMVRRLSLKRENVTINCNGKDIKHAKEA